MKKDLQRERHEDEILNTRRNGFGGSDADMVIAIAKKLEAGIPLAITERRRLRVIKGLEEPVQLPPTADMTAGHDFEDEQQSSLCGLGYMREYFMLPPKNKCTFFKFSVFAHADYYSDVEKRVVECKWSRTLTAAEIKERYNWQLQWYYMLGVQFVTLRFRDIDGNVGDVQIQRNDVMVRDLLRSLAIIELHWEDVDLTINEQSGSQLPPDIAQAVHDMEWLKEEISSREAKYKELQAQVRLWMEKSDVQKVNGERYTLTYTPATEAVKFDTKGLEKTYPKIYEQFKQYTMRSAYVTLKARKEGE